MKTRKRTSRHQENAYSAQLPQSMHYQVMLHQRAEEDNSTLDDLLQPITNESEEILTPEEFHAIANDWDIIEDGTVQQGQMQQLATLYEQAHNAANTVVAQITQYNSPLPEKPEKMEFREQPLSDKVKKYAHIGAISAGAVIGAAAAIKAGVPLPLDYASDPTAPIVTAMFVDAAIGLGHIIYGIEKDKGNLVYAGFGIIGFAVAPGLYTGAVVGGHLGRLTKKPVERGVQYVANEKERNRHEREQRKKQIAYNNKLQQRETAAESIVQGAQEWSRAAELFLATADQHLQGEIGIEPDTHNHNLLPIHAAEQLEKLQSTFETVRDIHNHPGYNLWGEDFNQEDRTPLRKLIAENKPLIDAPTSMLNSQTYHL